MRSGLAKLLLNEARQSGKCAGLTDVFITGPHPERSVTLGSELCWRDVRRFRHLNEGQKVGDEIENGRNGKSSAVALTAL